MSKEDKINQDIRDKVHELLDIKEGELPDLSDFGIPIDKALIDENQNKDE